MESVVLKQKDRLTVQVKVRYMLARGEHRRNTFRARLYFFFPQSFGIGPRTLAPRALHDQIQQYVRFHTPELSAAEILNPASALSPLARIAREIERGREAGTLDVAHIRYEARLLGTIYKALLRDTLYLTDEPDEPEAMGQRRAVTAEGWVALVEVVQRMHNVTRRLRAREAAVGGDAAANRPASGVASGAASEAAAAATHPPGEVPPDATDRPRNDAATNPADGVAPDVTAKLRSDAAPDATFAEAHSELALIDEYLSLLLEQFFSSYLTGESEGGPLDSPAEPSARPVGKGKSRRSAESRIAALRTATSGPPELRTADLHLLDPQRADWLAKMIRKEERYRRKAGYPTCPTGLKSATQLEEYVYRKTMLRRYASQVLFFPVQPTNTYKRAEHLLYALAAGVAMVVATTIAFFGQSRYGNATFSLFVLLVVGYMVKDRLKELSRDLFARKLGHYFPDRTLHLRSDRAVDSRERTPLARWLRRRLGLTRPPKIATVALRTTYVAAAALPDPIRTLRNRGDFEKAVLGVDSEQTLLFEHRTILRSRVLRTLHTRIRGLANVIAIDLEPFVRRLAVQHAPVPEVLGKHQVNVRAVQRVYHMNMIVELEGTGERTLRRYRLVVTKRGILRIEPVRPPPRA